MIFANMAVMVSLIAFAVTYISDFTSGPSYAFVTGLVASLMGAFLAFFFARALKFASRKEPVVFISYAHKDADFVRKLVDELQKMDVCPLFDQFELKVGDDIRIAVDNMIDRSDYFAFIISTNSVESSWAKKEIEQAMKRDKRILPVVIDLNSVPEELSGIYYADFSKDFETGMAQLRKTLQPNKRG
jgi:hypothetical protein